MSRLLLYGDGSVGQGRNALFAEQQATASAGWTLSQNQTHDGTWRVSALLGASYTLLSGWTQTLELLYNGDGYTSRERREACVSERDPLRQHRTCYGRCGGRRFVGAGAAEFARTTLCIGTAGPHGAVQ
jgi:hypothetical protein